MAATVVAPSEGNEVRREGRQEVRVPNMTCDVGEPTPGDPAEERGHRGYGTVGGKEAGQTEAHKRLNETTADSGAGEGDAGDGAHLAVPSHRPGLDA